MRSSRFQALSRVWDYLFDDWSTRLAQLGLGRRAVASRKIPLGRKPSRFTLETLEDRITPDGRPLPLPFVFVGSASGAPPLVRAYHADTGELAYERTPFDAGFTGGVRVAAGDINHDGIPDLIAAAGPGAGPHVRIFDGRTGDPIAGPLGSFYAYDPAFTGGVYVASGDVDGDGTADLITAAGAGGGPHIKVFSGQTGLLIDSFYAYAPDFSGGATVASADFNGDGRAEVAVGAGAGAGPHVKIFDLQTHDVLAGPLGSFLAFDMGVTGGVDVGTDFLAGDTTGDGNPDLVVGAGPGTGSRVQVYDGVTGVLVADFSPFGEAMTAGVRVSTSYVDDDPRADIIVGTGPGPTATVKVFSGLDFTELAAPMSGYAPFGSAYTGGLFVAGSNDPQYAYGLSSVSPRPTVMVNGTVTLTETLNDLNSNDGYQTPTGTVTFYSYWGGNSVAGERHTLGTAIAVPYGVTGQSKATLTLAPFPLGVGTYTLTASYSGDGWFFPINQGIVDYNYQVTGPPQAAGSGDLDIIDSNGVEVVEANEENPGGWVPQNNDNDNYNFLDEPGWNTLHKYDRDENGKVDGENDLVEITIHDLVPAGPGQFTLTGWGSRIKVWRTSDKVGAVPLDTVIDPGQATHLWVEGMLSSEAPRDEQIRLVWRSTGGGSVLVDRVAFTVYGVGGAMNVPEYAKYWYVAEVQGGEPRFEAVTGVQSLTQGPPAGGAPFPSLRAAEILWAGGPTVGVYRVYPTAGNDFFVNRQVNVVKVEIAAAGANNKLDYDQQTMRQTFVPNGTLIASANPTPANPIPAMAAHLRVTEIKGPIVDGQMRGVRFLEVGVMQNGTFTQMHGDYNGFATAKRRVSSLEGKSFLDAVTGDPGGNTIPSRIPWYDSYAQTGTSGFFAYGADPGANAPITNVDFNVSDTPRLFGTDLIDLTIGAETKSVDRFAIVFDLKLYLAVRTKETILDSDEVYTQRAKAAWSFDGSGTVVAGVWTKTGTGNTGAASFTAVTDGSVVPLSTAPVANTQLAGETWTTVNR